MTSRRAWVTLTTNDSYAMGALVLASSLKEAQTGAELVCLITSSVSSTMKAALYSHFDSVKEVTLIDSNEPAILELINRPELGVTLTKLHCWRLLDYETCVFLDADTLVLRNCDELFDHPELSAAPDVGWPDCFNSGMFVFKPSEERYQELLKFVTETGSFDGGDQGLLNSFFPNWRRLSFTYNTSTSTVYTYLPAFKQYEKDVKILHFLGPTKPWNLSYDVGHQKLGHVPGQEQHTRKYLERWWELFHQKTYPVLRHVNVEANIEEICAKIETVEICPSPTRRTEPSLEAWEQGDIDYAGVDAFDNILTHIKATIAHNPAPFSPVSYVQRSEEEKSSEDEKDTPLLNIGSAATSVTPRESQKNRTTPNKRPRPGTFEAWLMGEIDYMGVDAFDNILSHIKKTLARNPSRKRVARKPRPLRIKSK